MIFPAIPELAFLAVLAAFWRQARGLFDRVRGLFVQKTILRGSIARSVSDYLLAEARVVRWGDVMIQSTSAWVRPVQKVRDVAFEVPPGTPMLALWQRRPVAFRRMKEGGHGGSDIMPSGEDHLILMHLRGTLNMVELTRAALDWMNVRETTGQRFRVIHVGGKRTGETDTPLATRHHHSHPPVDIRVGLRYLHWTEEQIGSPKPVFPFDSYALGDVGAEIREDFRNWCSLKDWYLSRGIPWRRGHLLYGPPGTGKTALVRALAQEADMPVYAYDLSSLGNEEFRHHWREMQESAPCIALIEDIDGVFHGRENVLAKVNTMRDSLTFDCLLNAIGGIETADGTFIVVTTNRPDLLDDALGRPDEVTGTTRPGRLDRAFRLPFPNEEQRSSILRRILGRCGDDDIAITEGMSAAQVTEWAVSMALQGVWGEQPQG